MRLYVCLLADVLKIDQYDRRTTYRVDDLERGGDTGSELNS